MKKKTKTILLILVMAALFGFNFVMFAQAEGDNGGVSVSNNAGSGGGGGAGGDFGTSGWLYDNKQVGVRVSYVDQDGKLLAGPFDIIDDPAYTSNKWRGMNGILTLNGTKNKTIRQNVTGGSFANSGIIGTNAKALVIGADGKHGTTTYTGGWWITMAKSYFKGNKANANNVYSYLVAVYNKLKAAADKTKQAVPDDSEIRQLLNEFLAEIGSSETFDTLLTALESDPTLSLASQRYIQFEPLFFAEKYNASTNRQADTLALYGTASEIVWDDVTKIIVKSDYIHSGIGVYPRTGEKAPKPWGNPTVANGIQQPSYDQIKDVNQATAVGHIYLGGLIEAPKYSCDAIAAALAKEVKPSNETLYHELVEKLRTASEANPFEYELDLDNNGEKERVTVNEPQNFELLEYDLYMDPQKNKYEVGTAFCKAAYVCDPRIDPACNCDGKSFPGVASPDACVTGQNKYSDYPGEDGWLVCGTSYTDNGLHTSDNTNHVTTQADTDPTLTMANGTPVYGNTVGNDPYCKLYCFEKFETSFPTSVYGVKAGQVFAWGSRDGTFGSVHIEKTCKNKVLNEALGEGYLYKKWKRDYVSNEKELVNDYLQYAANRYYLEKIGRNASNIPVKPCTVADTWPDGSPKTYNCVAAGEDIRKTYTDSSRSNDHETGPYIGNKSKNSTDHEDDCTADTVAEAKKCAQGAVLQNYKNDEEKYYKLWKDREQDEKAYQLYIKQCTKNLKYVYETVINLVFDEPVNNAYGPNTRNFSSRDELDMDPPKDPLHETGYNTNNVDVSKCKDRNSYTYKCQYDSGCKPIKLQVKDCEQVTWEIEGDWTYSFPAGIFEWYSYKVDGTVMNEPNKPSASDAYFYYIGYTLPTALSLTDGQYEMSVAVTNLGDNATSNQGYNIPNGHFVDLVGTNYFGKSGFDYTCIYEVENEIFGYDCQYTGNSLLGYSPEFCDPSDDPDSDGYLNGVDVAYRVIQLLEDSDSINKSFPGRDGNGRRLGKNWQLTEEELHRILDARVIQTDQAMYEIMLDINAIQFIRKDNSKYFNGSSTGANPYTSYIDYNGQQKIICVGDSGERKYCASTFLDTLQNLNGGALNDEYILRGTCLPQGLTAEARANEILANGCGNSYTYPTINWAR